MSTRRARIKAIASLPVRRKNVDSNEANKISQCSTKYSPKTNSDTGKLTDTVSTDQHNEHSTETVSQTSNESSSAGKATLASPIVEKVSVIVTPTLPCRNNFSSISSPFFVTNSPKNPLEPDINKNKLTGKKYESDSDTENILSTRQNQRILAPTPTSARSIETDLLDGITKINNSVPNSDVAETDAVDGIVPLNSAPKVPKPLDLLKNHIISENAEVSFDPIVPLPSPSKVRPKLRPAPRLAPLRRNSIQV